MKTVKMILAKSRNGVIGNDGSIPWNCPEDMEYFKSVTTGSTVVMGRKTWESLPKKYRPLPNRENIIISSDPEYRAEGAFVTNSVENAIRAATKQTVWIIGGASIYNQAIPYVKEAHVTIIHQDYAGDTYAPVLNGFELTSCLDVWHKNTTFGRKPKLTFTILERRQT